MAGEHLRREDDKREGAEGGGRKDSKETSISGNAWREGGEETYNRVLAVEGVDLEEVINGHVALVLVEGLRGYGRENSHALCAHALSEKRRTLG